MERGKGPQRRTPLQRGSGLAPGGPLARSAWVRPTRPNVSNPQPVGRLPADGGESLAGHSQQPVKRQAAQKRAPGRKGLGPAARPGPTKVTRGLLVLRAAGELGGVAWCEWPGCWQVGTDPHHRLNRKNGGRFGERAVEVNSVGWLLWACRPHHERVTSAHGAVLEEARSMGWVLWECQDALRVAVLTRHAAGAVLLGGDGTWTPAEQ